MEYIHSKDIAAFLGFAEKVDICSGVRKDAFDIGMMSVPEEILNAPRSLNAEEYGKVKTHVHLAEKVLRFWIIMTRS